MPPGMSTVAFIVCPGGQELTVLNDSLTCLSLLGLTNAVCVWVDGNNGHVIDGVGVQVPEDGGGGAA